MKCDECNNFFVILSDSDSKKALRDVGHGQQSNKVIPPPKKVRSIKMRYNKVCLSHFRIK